MLTEKNYGKHTKWSRYQSQIKPTDPETWSYDIDDTKWPAVVANNVRILSINCLRFPKTFYSKIILANLIMSSNCDVAILQEISTISMLPELRDFINEFLGSDVYSFTSGKQSIRNLQLSVFYKSSIWDFESRVSLALNDITGIYPFPRLPFQVLLSGPSFDINITNLHLPSNGYQDNVIRKEACFEALGDHFDWSPSGELLLLGGDFNTATNASLYTTYLNDFQIVYGSYYSASDIILFHKDNYGPIIKSGFSQYFWDYESYMDLTRTEWRLYFSDHKPVILDLPI